MSNFAIRFETSDFIEALPEEGLHTGAVHSARPRTSERGNPTLQVVYQLDDVEPTCDRVTEYFVVAGANPQAVRIARRRLLAMCGACGLVLHENDELDLARLVGRRLQLRIGHETYQGQIRIRVLGYRPR
jgi:hypothetical protein